MRRLLTAIAILLLASPLLAQTGANAGSTKAAQEFAKALTASTFFGVPRYTTVALPTCNAANTGAVAFNTTSTFLTFCNGTSWGDANSGAASAVTPGSTTVGTSVSCVLFADGVSVLQCASDLPGQVNISGPDAATNVEIGSVTTDANAGTGGNAIAIGSGADNSGNSLDTILIGRGGTFAATSTNSVSIGGINSAAGGGANSIQLGPNNAKAGAGAAQIQIGNGQTNGASGNNNLLVGNTATIPAGTTANSIIMGATATVPANTSNVFVAGGNTFPISNVYFSEGVINASALAYTINGTGGSGSNNAGGAVKMAGGFGTGTAAGGDVALQRSPSIATGTTAQTATDALYIRSQMKALGAGVATAVARISVPQGVAGLTGWTGGTLFYTVVANDATNYQATSGSINFAFVNEAGTEACTNLGTVSSIADATPTGTLTATVTGASNAADTCDLLINAASSLTESTLAAFWSVTINGPGTVTPQ